MVLVFERDDQELRLEIRQEAATADFLLVWHPPDGREKTERFSDQTMLLAYVDSLEEWLRGEHWTRVGSTGSDVEKRQSTTAKGPDASDVVVGPGNDRRAEETELYLLKGAIRTKARDAEAPPDEVYELAGTPADIPAEWQNVATYELELPARCPHCREPIRTLKVLRLTRAQVAFTSTLPRGGRVMVCPLCERILSAELSGLI